MVHHPANQQQNVHSNADSRRPSARSLITTLTNTFVGANSTARNSIFLTPSKRDKQVTLLDKTGGCEDDLDKDEAMNCGASMIPGEMLWFLREEIFGAFFLDFFINILNFSVHVGTNHLSIYLGKHYSLSLLSALIKPRTAFSWPLSNNKQSA